MQKDLMSQSLKTSRLEDRLTNGSLVSTASWGFSVFLTNVPLDRLKKWHREVGSVPSIIMTDACHVVCQKTCYLDY